MDRSRELPPGANTCPVERSTVGPPNRAVRRPERHSPGRSCLGGPCLARSSLERPCLGRARPDRPSGPGLELHGKATRRGRGGHSAPTGQAGVAEGTGAGPSRNQTLNGGAHLARRRARHRACRSADGDGTRRAGRRMGRRAGSRGSRGDLARLRHTDRQGGNDGVRRQQATGPSQGRGPRPDTSCGTQRLLRPTQRTAEPRLLPKGRGTAGRDAPCRGTPCRDTPCRDTCRRSGPAASVGRDGPAELASRTLRIPLASALHHARRRPTDHPRRGAGAAPHCRRAGALGLVGSRLHSPREQSGCVDRRRQRAPRIRTAGRGRRGDARRELLPLGPGQYPSGDLVDNPRLKGRRQRHKELLPSGHMLDRGAQACGTRELGTSRTVLDSRQPLHEAHDRRSQRLGCSSNRPRAL
jgi:hypothetical protein